MGWLCNKLMQAGWDYEIRFWTMLEQLYSSGVSYEMELKHIHSSTLGQLAG